MLEVADLQLYTIERLTAENAALRAERNGLKFERGLGEGVRRLLLDLLDARTFEEAIAAGHRLGPGLWRRSRRHLYRRRRQSRHHRRCGRRAADRTGLVSGILGPDGTGVILSSGGEVLLGPGGGDCKSLAVFRLRIGHDTPAAVYVLGARAAGCFEGEEIAAEIGFFARALERAIRAWLDLPKS